MCACVCVCMSLCVCMCTCECAYICVCIHTPLHATWNIYKHVHIIYIFSFSFLYIRPVRSICTEHNDMVLVETVMCHSMLVPLTLATVCGGLMLLMEVELVEDTVQFFMNIHPQQGSTLLPRVHNCSM